MLGQDAGWGPQAGPSQASGTQLCLHMVWLGAFLCAQPGLRGAPRKPPWASVWNSGAGSPVQARAWLGQGQSLPLGPQGLRSPGAEAPYALWRSLWGQGQQNVGLGSHSGVGAQSVGCCIGTWSGGTLTRYEFTGVRSLGQGPLVFFPESPSCPHCCLALWRHQDSLPGRTQGC